MWIIIFIFATLFQLRTNGMRIRDGFTGQRFLILPYQKVEELAAHPLTGELYLTRLGYFPKAHYHYVSRPQGIQEYILLYCTEGRGWVQFRGQTFPMRANEFIVIPPGEPHVYYAQKDDPWSIYWVHFGGRGAQTLCEGLYTPQAILPTDDSRISDRIELFDEIYTALDTNHSSEAILYANMSFVHLMATFRYVEIYRATKNIQQGNGHVHTKVQQAIHYMNDNLERRLTIDELAGLCGYSRSHLHQLFLREAGQAPMDYFNRLKINKACMLLAHTTMSVTQIALKLSFSESQYFARLFKKVMGISATEYRKQNGGVRKNG